MSGLRSRRFLYPLAAVLTKRSWDVDALIQELASARHALSARQREAADLVRGLDEVNESLKRMRTGGAALDLSRQQIALDYRAREDESLAAKHAEVERARTVCEQIAEQLTRGRLALKGHEEHRDGLRQAHDRVTGIAEAKEADDSWLARNAGAGARS